MPTDNPLAHECALTDLELCFAWMRDIPERRVEPVDVILALGNAAANRTAGLAAQLHRNGVAPLIVCCGGRGRSTERFELSEARVMATVLRLCNINGATVLLEENSTNTAENLTTAFDVLDMRHLPRERILLVHDSGTLRRDRNLLWQQWPEYRPNGGTGTALHWSWGETFAEVALCSAFGETIEPYAHMFVGTLQRLIECSSPPRPWHLPDEPPAEVLAAYHRLKERFTNQLLEF